MTAPMLRFGLAVTALVLGADQLTKYWAEAALLPYNPIPIMPSFNLTLSYNTGAAFSVLAGQGGWQRWLLAAIAVMVSGYLLWWLRSLGSGERVTALALGLVLGGAIGNVIDRLVHGHVIDFIDVYAGSWHWPAFNLADSGITVGVVLLIAVTLLRRSK